MSIINSQPLIGASGQGGAYNLTKSLRFRSSASAYLNRTFGTPTSRRIFTFSVWTKRGELVPNDFIFGRGTGPESYLQWSTDNTLEFYDYTGSSYSFRLVTTQVFRDPSAWYHIVVAVDTTQATAANRIKIYVNGVQVTAFSTATYPSQNFDSNLNTNSTVYIGRSEFASNYIDCYMTEINFIDGQQLTPSSFGETSTSTGVWIPKKYTGTYGTNGFYLPFTDVATTSGSNAGLGKDFSGNGNYWTTNNISVTTGTTYDSMSDVPTLTSATTANYCVLNPLDKGGNVTITNGNLSYSVGATNMARATFQIPSTGKWYWECTQTSANAEQFGIATSTASTGTYLGGDANGWSYGGSGNKFNNNSSSAYGASFTNGDVIGVAFDATAGTLTFYKNGTSQGTAFSGLTGTYFPAGGGNLSSASVNFGQQGFTYTPPTGFVALNTFNLPTPTIGATASTQASAYMNSIIWTGNGTSTRTLTGLNFQPDFVWTKSRSNAYYHNLYDVVRGFGSAKSLHSNDTLAEGTLDLTYGYVSAATSTGFSVANGSTSGQYVNENGSTYVAWNWKANGSGSSNTAGSITSTVSANTTAGFSIVTYTGTGSASDTVGHGLGVAPSMVITKRRSSGSGAFNWMVKHSSLASNHNLLLESTGASTDVTSGFGSGGIANLTSSTTFGFLNGSSGNPNNSNTSGATYVAYCFAQVAGYSAFGSYTGNGSSDGTFVYTGFRPRFILIKASSFSTASTVWTLFDTSRNPYNAAVNELYANSSSAEGVDSSGIDILSNGFKPKRNSEYANSNGQTYIYMAVAENPFKFSNAR